MVAPLEYTDLRDGDHAWGRPVADLLRIVMALALRLSVFLWASIRFRIGAFLEPASAKDLTGGYGSAFSAAGGC